MSNPETIRKMALAAINTLPPHNITVTELESASDYPVLKKLMQAAYAIVKDEIGAQYKVGYAEGESSAQANYVFSLDGTKFADLMDGKESWDHRDVGKYVSELEQEIAQMRSELNKINPIAQANIEASESNLRTEQQEQPYFRRDKWGGVRQVWEDERVSVSPQKLASEELTDLWHSEFYNHAVGLCGLCGNSGKIDTRGRAISAAGVEAGMVSYCICSNGRSMRLTNKPEQA